MDDVMLTVAFWAFLILGVLIKYGIPLLPSVVGTVYFFGGKSDHRKIVGILLILIGILVEVLICKFIYN